ncbi:hypothetical protein LOK49_LG05G00724 [Camellia lanceoleosa]|uniref:Uncharacterized protein n=1 Tax=Camellia lanceoleosa TaxID=1840588 RepID=A0ACC0HJ87_9ERIC|nr:hypothetical protein LOK49_LG05G00724 [Camellia lanceoleosa]
MFFEHCLDRSLDFASPHNMGDSSIEVMKENCDASQEAKVVGFALALQEVRCFSVVLECVLAPVAAAAATFALRIPTIGIGAGPFCSGQVN